MSGSSLPSRGAVPHLPEGVTVNELSVEEWDQASLRLCVRVIDLAEPVVPSEERDCAGCGFGVWYDPRASVFNPAKEHIVCERCFEYEFGA